MSRPIYYDQRNVDNETNAISLIQRIWDCDVQQTEYMAPVDFLLIRDGKSIGSVEYKRRKHNHGDYSTVMISAHKLDHIETLGPLYFLIQWDDKWGYAELTEEHRKTVKIGGRTVQTRDSGDIEPVAHIPISQFEVVE